jgi:ribosomal protein S18 acetylase RimI-like enzyme
MVEEAVERQEYRIGWTRNEEGRVNGYILWGRTPFTEETCDLYWMAVDPRDQGKGIGRRLVRMMERDMRSRGERFVRIETSSRDDYRKTRDFYQRVGYPEVVRLPHFYASGNDLCIHYGEIPPRMG